MMYLATNRQMKRSAFLVIAMVTVTKAEITHLQGFREFKNSKFDASEKTIRTVRTYSLLACAATCAADSACMAAYFDKSSRNCMTDTCGRPSLANDSNGTVFAKSNALSEVQNPIDCDETSGESGMKTISLGPTTLPVFCVVDADCVIAWTIIQQRLDGSVEFNRNWDDYRIGFGSCTGECWLGNTAISVLTNRDSYMLRIDLEDFDGNTAYAIYDTFVVAPESDNFRLTIGGYSGDAGESIQWLSGSSFSTIDRDNDVAAWSCASAYSSGWWYSACHSGNLNGPYLNGIHGGEEYTGIVWNVFRGPNYSLKKSRMMIRRK